MRYEEVRVGMKVKPKRSMWKHVGEDTVCTVIGFDKYTPEQRLTITPVMRIKPDNVDDLPSAFMREDYRQKGYLRFYIRDFESHCPLNREGTNETKQKVINPYSYGNYYNQPVIRSGRLADRKLYIVYRT